ncbi:hypothetical protein J3F83DRAFT_88710 [Trichoderma novae-zelandiae]
MLLLQSQGTDVGEGLRTALVNMHELAEQVICYSEDMEYMPGRSDLMRLPDALLPRLSFQLDHLLHNNEDMRDALSKWADQKGLVIGFDQWHLGPQIMWLQGGSLSIKENRVSFFTFLPQPKSRGTGEVTNSAAEQEPRFEGIIERPIAQGQFVYSSVRCRVGDVIILEGQERLLLHKEGEAGPPRRGICLLACVLCTAPGTG